MAKFMRDPHYTQDQLRMLQESIAFAEYELTAAIHVARNAGMTWDQVAEALGYQRKGSALNFTKRQPGITFASLDDGEAERIGRLLGLGQRASRYQVRIITKGKPGVSAVTRKTLSTHLRQDVANRRALARHDDTAEVWRVDPDGTETNLGKPTAAGSRKREWSTAEEADF